MLLKDKIAIVTGANKGIGKATALRFAQEGAKVVVVNRNEQEGRAVAQMITDAGGEAIYIKADVSKEEDVKNYVNKTIEKYGRIDVFFNNAGIEGDAKPTAEYSVEEFDRVMSINCRGIFLGLKYVLTEMVKNQSGSIINTSSIGGLVGHLNFSGYCASKHAVIGLTKVAGIEYSKMGIRINCICPGPINTEMVANAAKKSFPDDPNQYYTLIKGLVPASRIGEADEVAGLVTFLASDQAPFINGAAIPIDGCMTAV